MKFFLIIFIFCYIQLYSEELVIGKIFYISGNFEKSNINSYDKFNNKNTSICQGDRIVVYNKSSVKLLLYDGTSIEIFERSDLIIHNLRNNGTTPTSLFSDYGQYKVIQNNNNLETSLIFTTRTAVIKSVKSTINIIVANEETGCFVYKGKVGFVSADPSIIDAYVITSGWESFIRKGFSPSKPVKIKLHLRSTWDKRYRLSDDLIQIIGYTANHNVADWFFLKKN